MSCSCGKDTCNCAEPETVMLQDEDGTVHPFYVSSRIEANHQPYIFLVSIEDDTQYALLRVETDNKGASVYRNIEDEAEWAAIEEAFRSMSTQ